MKLKRHSLEIYGKHGDILKMQDESMVARWERKVGSGSRNVEADSLKNSGFTEKPYWP